VVADFADFPLLVVARVLPPSQRSYYWTQNVTRKYRLMMRTLASVVVGKDKTVRSSSL